MHDDQEQGVGEPKTQTARKKEKITGGGIIVSSALLLLSGALNYFGANPRILWLPAIGLCMLILYGAHVYINSELARRQPVNPAVVQQVPRPNSALASLSDGQRFVLKQKLRAYAGHAVRLILIGNDPQPAILFEQLVDIFTDSGWRINKAGPIGTVSIAGANFPNGPYLTSENMAVPIVGNVFSIFSGAGVTLPLTPDAYMGPASMGTPPEIVIVIH